MLYFEVLLRYSFYAASNMDRFKTSPTNRGIQGDTLMWLLASNMFQTSSNHQPVVFCLSLFVLDSKSVLLLPPIFAGDITQKPCDFSGFCGLKSSIF